MSSRFSFTSNEGVKIVNSIVTRLVPKWINGLRKLQLICIPKILNLEDVFAIDAMGGGKSALFGIPILLHLEISQNADSYPLFNVPIRLDPIGVVVTPTKGLANNIVKRLKEDLGINGFAYTSENLSLKRRAGIDIVKEITSCQYRIVCINPEHLCEREWYLISNSTLFRQNIIFACAEEGHPGPPFLSVCLTLGFSGSRFHLICCSNEHSNTKIILHTLTSAIGGTEFPQIIPYLNQQCKTVIHVQTIDLGYCIFMFLFNLTPASSNPLCRIHMYNSLASEKYNKKTIELIDTDPQCQVVIATKALSLGIHVEELRDSIAVGTADTQDNGKQDAEHAGRKEGVIAHRIIFTTTTELNKVRKIVEASGEVSVAAISKVKQTTKTKKETKNPLDPAKVVFLAETVCQVACENIIYDNPPLELSRMDCIQAERLVPCDLCCTHYHIPENHFPPSTDEMTLPPFIMPTITTKKRKPRKKVDKLKEKELEVVGMAFLVYETQLYAEERLVAPHRY
ncbi:hypothetical protein BT96DRAFT_937720 [Gymnopus androsaceus JB14]|uniref:Helicase ATP-binding domain-containing protein n=1 Tax=Gymnopus androsaceus JB14 TaxID=1447944 RepID=A0A6A4HTD9_9AGAR|nr:hypothetical protein BT96DRAFT_937720 [Gymnopus androsaceus JB14]